MPLLSDLPAEILHQITRYLVLPQIGFSDAGLCSLRLTCRALCLKTQYEFGRAAFSTLRLDLHPKTLQRLLTICRRPAFGQAVKKIVFAHWGDEYITFPAVSDDERGKGELLETQVQFVLKEIFEEAFSGMPNLKEIVMVSPFVARFRRHEYSLDAGFSQAPQGSDVAFEETYLTMDSLYILLGKALTTTNTHISALETTGSLGPPGDNNWQVSSISTQSLQATAQALRCMEHLKITLDASETPNAGGYLGHALRDMSLLTRLDIRFHGRRAIIWTPSRDRPFRTAVVAAMRSLQHVHFPRLAALTLRTAQVDECVLVDFLLAHQKTLQSAALYYVDLVPEARWGSILALVLDDLENLEELHIATNYGSRAGPGTFDLMGRSAVVQRLSSIVGRTYTGGEEY